MNKYYYFAQDSEQYVRGFVKQKYFGENVMARINSSLDALGLVKSERLVKITRDQKELDELEEKCNKNQEVNSSESKV